MCWWAAWFCQHFCRWLQTECSLSSGPGKEDVSVSFLKALGAQMTPSCSSGRMFVCFVSLEDCFIDCSITPASIVCMDWMLPDAAVPWLVLKDLPQNNCYCGCPCGCWKRRVATGLRFTTGPWCLCVRHRFLQGVCEHGEHCFPWWPCTRVTCGQACKMMLWDCQPGLRGA